VVASASLLAAAHREPMRLAGAVICVIGYGLALPLVFRIRKIFNERRVRWFAALMVATVLVIVGYVLLGRPAEAAAAAAAAENP
jgi:hypothetical protein